jgi:hypothetical protein
MSTDDDDDDEYIIHGKLLDPIHEGELTELCHNSQMNLSNFLLILTNTNGILVISMRLNFWILPYQYTQLIYVY